MEGSFFIKYIIFSVGTFVFSLLINRLFLKFVKSLGMRNVNETVIRWNETSKPSIGGLSFYIIFLLTISTYSFAFSSGESIFNLREIGVLMACTLGFLMGLGDDAYDTKPILKSVTQITCGIILILTGTMINLFDNQILNVAITLVWVMGIMNSVNMLDNMDGITGSVALIILLTMLGCLILSDFTANFYFILLTGIICALLGFLFFNWHPSKMFMGDSGSQFLGIFLAAMGIIFFWNIEPLNNSDPGFTKKILFPLLAFIVPIADTTTVVINRLSRGQSPFIGGKDHTTHNLARIGLSDSKVAITVSVLSLISGLLISYNYNSDKFSTGKSVALVFYILLIFLVLFSVTKIRENSTKQ